MSEQSLKNRAIHGVGWSAIDNISQYAVSFIVSIVLARMLTPDDYGLIGIIAIFTAICTCLVNSGFLSALIRKKDVTDDDYSTAFVINLFMSLLLFAVLYLCAPFIATFFNREELISLTRISSAGVIIGAFALVQTARLTREIDFKTQTKVTLIASIFSGVIGIGMAVLGYGVWSLVAQGLSSQLLRTIFLWLFSHWAPKLHFSTSSFKSLFGYGWKMMLSNLLDTTWKELYQVVVGKFYCPATLGQYTRAKQFSTLFSSNLTIVIQRVTYPVLSNIQDDKLRLVSAYRRIIKVTMFITAISMFALGAVAEPLLYCLIGPQWQEAAIYLPLICITGSFYPLHAINLNMLQVQGRSDLFLILEIIKKIIAIGPLCIGAVVGIMPMLYASIVTSVICYFLNSYFPGKILGYTSWMQIKDIAPSYGVATIIAISVWFLKYLPLSNWVILPIQIIVGIIVLFILCKIFDIEEYKETKDIIKPLIFKHAH